MIAMNVVSKKTLRSYWDKHANSRGILSAWHDSVSKELWNTPNDIKKCHGSADFVGDKVVFNIGGNKYRLIAKVNYRAKMVFIKFIGTHAQYDKIDVSKL